MFSKVNRYRTPFIAIVSLAFAICWGAFASAQQSTQSLEQIVEGMRSFEQRFLGQDSWLIAYKQIREYRNLPPAAPKDYPAAEHINARKGEKLFVKQVMHYPDGPRTDYCVWRDGVCSYRTGNVYQIHAELRPEGYEYFYYTIDMFLNTFHGFRILTPEIMGATLPGNSIAESFWQALPRGIDGHLAEFIVRENLEEVDGTMCHVLERPGKDIIHVDVEHGYVWRRRQYYQSEGVLLFDAFNSALRERLPGLWMPDRITTVRYNHDPNFPEILGKVRFSRTNEVTEVRFNDLEDELFTVPLPENGVIVDIPRGMRYAKFPEGAKDQEIFNGTLGLVRLSNFKMLKTTPSSHTMSVIIIVNGLIVGIALLVFQLRTAFV